MGYDIGIAWRRLNCAISSSAPSSQSPLLLPVRSLVVVMLVKIPRRAFFSLHFLVDCDQPMSLSEQNSVTTRTL